MTLQEFVQALRIRWRVLVATTLVVVVAALAVAFLRPPSYTSHVLLYVSTPSTSDTAYQNGLLSEQRVASYVELVNRPSVAAAIVARLGLPVDPATVSSEISATTSAESVLIDVSVNDPSPDRAAAIANALGAVFPDLVAKIEQPRTPGAQPTVFVSPVEPATVPTAPSSVGPATAGAVGLVAGLLLGVVAAVVVHRLDTRIRTRQRLAEITGRPALGNLPRDPVVEDRPLIVVDEPRSPLAEAYRALRTTLRYLQVGRTDTAPVFLVTSARAGEGKSTTSVNVAAALAAGGERVLLVEADLRRPTVGATLGLESAVGLTTVLTGRIALPDAIQHHRKAGIDVLVSGPLPPNPSELLGSEPMRDLVDGLRDNYSIILVDATPLLPVSDAAALLPATDGALLVCRYGLTTEAQVRAAMTEVEAVGSEVLGVVVTMAPRSSDPSYASYASPERADTASRRAANPRPGAPTYRPTPAPGPPSGPPAARRTPTHTAPSPRPGSRVGAGVEEGSRPGEAPRAPTPSAPPEPGSRRRAVAPRWTPMNGRANR